MKRVNWKPILGTAAVAALLIFGKTFAADGDKSAQNSTPPPAEIMPKAGGQESVQSGLQSLIIITKAVSTPPEAKNKQIALNAVPAPSGQVTYTFALDSTVTSSNPLQATAEFREIYSIVRGANSSTLTTGTNVKQAVFSGGATSLGFDVYAGSPVSVTITLPSDSAGKQYFLVVTGSISGVSGTFSGGDVIAVPTP